MKKLKKHIVLSSLFLLAIGILSACKNEDPSVLKIFVRSSSNQLQNGAKVVVIGDVNSNPATLPFVDTLVTNTSGFVTFNMDDYFNKSGENNTTGYFDVIVKQGTSEGTEYVRCRAHITTVETVFLN
ncbi:MAG: hypothetical protein NWR50_03775 [Crocinitomicaceae bacterium]|jgi:hypothetical protein|nr:hypothetical protein [Crocinitomicaceae bacterium]